MSEPTHQPQDPRGNSHNGRSDTPTDPPIHSISEADGQALEALLAARLTGATHGPIPAGLSERTDRLTNLLSLLDQDVALDPPADLTARTLAAIHHHEQRQRFTAQVQMLSEPRRTLGVNWRQLLTAAAVFILGASLLIPVMERQQADSRRFAGAANMGMTGQAIASYAADNQGQMPRGDVRPGMVWTEVGQPQAPNTPYLRSNSAHLYRLIQKGYAKPQHLTCPENPYADNDVLTTTMQDWTGPRAVSFSYQNQYTSRMLRLDEAPDMAVLADRNPIFDVQGDRIVFNPSVSMNAPSRAHRGMGQNVLTADGAVTWRVSPTLVLPNNDATDNIWTATGINFYNGNEVPADPYDSFLVP